MEDRVLITSFNHFTIMRMKERAPEIRYGFLAYDWRLDAGEAFFSLLSIFYSPGPWPVSKPDPGPLCLV